MLEDAILKALEELGGVATTKEINNKVIEILKLPDEIVLYEDDTSTGTKLDYRLRWARTNLKTKGKIANKKKGTWVLNRK